MHSHLKYCWDGCMHYKAISQKYGDSSELSIIEIGFLIYLDHHQVQMHVKSLIRLF